MAVAGARSGDSNLFLDFVEAIADRHGQMEIRLEHLSLRLPLIRESLELNGTISVSVHLRELTDKEKQARVQKELRALAP
ncbi:MAG TPA: hypothetical protein VEL82_01010 [Thermoplasmata archaeon]|nr:hypothetical protein [Thermoplasmata archaeon]